MAITNSPPVFTVKKTSNSPATTGPRFASMRAHDWVQGAIQAARMQRVDGTLHFVGAMDGDFIFRCFDSDTSRVEHTIILNWEKKQLTCTCWDRRNEYPCPHLGAFYLHAFETMQRAIPKNINYSDIYPWWSHLNAS